MSSTYPGTFSFVDELKGMMASVFALKKIRVPPWYTESTCTQGTETYGILTTFLKVIGHPLGVMVPKWVNTQIRATITWSPLAHEFQ